MSQALKKQLKECFSSEGELEDALITECAKLCEDYNLTAEDLQFKWEATKFGSRQMTNRQFSLDSISALKAQIQREAAAEVARRQMTNLGGRLNSISRGRGGAFGANRNITMKAGPSASVPTPLAASSRIAAERKLPKPSRVRFSVSESEKAPLKSRRYRYMYEKTMERSEVLDDRIDEFSEIIREAYSITELGDASVSTEEDIVTVGRIVLDSESASAAVAGGVKLNEASLVFESSRTSGAGARTPLRFAPDVKVHGSMPGTGGTGLFPGAIVALRGKNGGAGWFEAKEILSLPPMAVSSPSAPTVKYESGDSSFSMTIAAGPFSTDSDLKFTPWHNFVSKIQASKPAIVVLLGPFVDCEHPRIKSFAIEHTPAEMVISHIIGSLREFFAISPGSMAVIIPNIKDIVSDHACYPQAGLKARDLGGEDPQIHFLPNPSHFTVNDVSFAASSVDVLFHLRKEEFFKRAEEVNPSPSPAPSTDPAAPLDAMSKLASHLLRQRSFYPLFPVPLDVSHEVNLDVSHSAEPLRLSIPGDQQGAAPNVLITTSRLKHFAKVVDSTLIINPSFLTKGTYANLTYHGDGPSLASKRIKVEIEKL